MSPSSGGGFELPRHSSGDGWRLELRRGHYSAAALTPRLTARGGSRASRAGPPPRMLPSGGAPAPSLVPPLPAVAPLLTSGLRGERLRATPAHFFSATPMSFHAGCAGCRQHCVVGIVGVPFWPWLCSFVASPPPKRYTHDAHAACVGLRPPHPRFTTLLRAAFYIVAGGFSDCDVVGAVALLWSNNLKLSPRPQCKNGARLNIT